MLHCITGLLFILYYCTFYQSSFLAVAVVINAGLVLSADLMIDGYVVSLWDYLLV